MYSQVCVVIVLQKDGSNMHDFICVCVCVCVVSDSQQLAQGKVMQLTENVIASSDWDRCDW